MTPSEDPSDWGAVPADDGPTSWGAVSHDDGPEAWGAVPEDEDAPSPLGSALRQGARSVGAGIGGALGMVGGAALGAFGGPAAPVTVPAAAIGGGFAGGMAGQRLEDWLLDKFGANEGDGALSNAQQQKDIETNPISSFAGQMAGSIGPGFGLGSGLKLAQRAIGAGIQGGLEAGQEAYRGDDMDPAKVGVAVIAGGLAGRPHGWVRNLEGRLTRAPININTSGDTTLPNRDVKQEYTDEAVPEAPAPRGPTPGTKGAANPEEWEATQGMLDKLDPDDPRYEHVQTYMDELEKVQQRPDGLTPSAAPRVALGVSESPAPPSQDATSTGQPEGQGAGTKAVAEGATDGRKDALKPGAQVSTQDSALMTQGDRAPDIAAALPSAQGKPPPEPPVETGLPQRAPIPQDRIQALHARNRGLDQEAPQGTLNVDRPAAAQAAIEGRPPTPEPPVETGLTAAVTPEPKAPLTAEQTASIERLRNTMSDPVKERFDALDPQEQAQHASDPEVIKAVQASENYRNPRTTEHDGKSYAVNGKPEKNRVDESVKAVKQAIAEIPEGDLSIERDKEGVNKKAIQEHAKDVVNRTNELYAEAKKKYGKDDPIADGDLFMPNLLENRLAEHTIFGAAKKAAAKNASWKTLEEYVTKLKDPTARPDVDSDIGLKDRPSLDDVQAAQPEGGRVPFGKFDNTNQVESSHDAAAHDTLRTWIDGLPDAEYDHLKILYPDLETNVRTTSQPERLLTKLSAEFPDDLTEAGDRTLAQRPGNVEHPAEGIPGGKRTAITGAKDIDTLERRTTGKSLKGTPEFEALAARYGGGKVATPEEAAAAKATVGDRLKAEEAAQNNIENIPTTWDAATRSLMKFAGDEGGGGPVPKWVSDWFSPKAESPADPARAPDVKQHLDQVGKVFSWIRGYANERASDKMHIRGNEAKALATGLTPEQWDQIERAVTDRTENALPGKLRETEKEVVAPLRDEGDATYQRIWDKNEALGLGIKNLQDPSLVGATRNVPRISIKEDVSDPETGNVVSGNKYSNMADSLRPREFAALHDEVSGDRLVLHRGDDGKFSIFQNGNVRPLTKLPSTFTGSIGDVLPLYKGGKKIDFKVDEAGSHEIEAATAGAVDTNGVDQSVKYIHNPVITHSNRLNQLQNVEANIDLIQKIKDDPWWKENTTTDWEKAKKLGYDQDQTTLDALGKQNGKDVYMPRNMRWLLNDMHQQGFGGDDSKFLAQAGSIMARTFLVTGSPIHVGNMLTNAAINRGYENITPKGLHDLGVYGGRAVRALMDPTNSKDYYNALDAGVQFQFHNTLTNDLIPNMMKRFGVEVAKTPWKYDPIAKAFGMSTPDLAKTIEHASTGEMWRIGDMFPLQRFMELTEGQGMDPKDAADEVNKFSSYASGPTFGSTGHVGRFMQQLMTDPRATLFGRWHMLLVRSMASIVQKGLGPDSTAAQRGQAAGQALAAAGIAYVIYPAVDKAFQAMSGNPDAKMGRRGMLAITDAIQHVFQGDKDYAKAVSPLITPAIPISMLDQVRRNRNWADKPIVQQMPWNSVRNVAKAGGQIADWTAQNAVPPYGNIAQGLVKGDTLAGTAGKFAAGMVGGQLPSPKARAYEAHIQQLNNRNMKHSDKNPVGPLSWLATHFGK